VLGYSMVLEEYITDKGQPLNFKDEKSRCLGEIKIGFDRGFRASSTWEVGYSWDFGNFQTVGRTRTETDSGVVCDRMETDIGVVCDRISNTSRTLLRSG